jgi:hypothetical protein
MQVIVFTTADDKSPEGTGPTLFLRDHPASALPRNPRGLAWRYFATVGLEDRLLDPEREWIEGALADGGSFISKRMI